MNLHYTAARVLTSGHPPETRTRVLTSGHSPGTQKQRSSFRTQPIERKIEDSRRRCSSWSAGKSMLDQLDLQICALDRWATRRTFLRLVPRNKLFSPVVASYTAFFLIKQLAPLWSMQLPGRGPSQERIRLLLQIHRLDHWR